MLDIHCHACGGFISDPARTAHRPAGDPAAIATPQSCLCTCKESVVYGPPAGYASIPAMKIGARLN
ncbi:MAG TPA: hypothetical protein VFD85_04435 [Gemmatimonadales bacterium]|nr:hypothetical protein [Gemmatimonadales bacterium]